LEVNFTRLVRVLPVVGALLVAGVLRRRKKAEQPASLWAQANEIVDEQERAGRPD
jgi:hypothetical protein